MQIQVQKRIAALVVLVLIASCLSVGLLADPKIQFSTPKNNNSHHSMVYTNSENKTSLKITHANNYITSTTHREIETSTANDPSQPAFQVTTDYGYTCTTGNPAEAIQCALDSLPQDRTTPYNVYLQGVFYPVCNIIMEDNVNFIGDNAVLISDSQMPIFVHDWTKNYSEKLGVGYEIDGKPYQDWITLQNVTFQYIQFKQLIDYNQPYNSAIYFYAGNSTGWGTSDNLSVYHCQFDGFYNCIQGLASNSNYVGNYFQDFSNNAIMIPCGNDIMIQNNIFEAPSNQLTVQQYQERDGPPSIQGGISVFFMDVIENILVNNNIFVEGTNSTGITFSSSSGNFLVTNNFFSGDGDAYSFDVFPRPCLSSGIRFSGNSGVADFCYNFGIYSNSTYDNF